MAESDGVFLKLKAANAAHVRRIRKQLKLTQEEAGRLIGVGCGAFQKYENGTTSPSNADFGLIERLCRHPEQIEFLILIRTEVVSQSVE